MAEFMVNIPVLKKEVLREEAILKELQKQIDHLKEVISSSALRSSTYRDALASLETTFAQLQDLKRGMNEYKECLSNAIALYEKTEESIVGNAVVKERLKTSRENLEKILKDFIQEEKYGKHDDSSKMSEDPVNLSTGNFIYDHTDLKIGGEIPISFQRFYNAMDSRKGSLGIRFLHNYEMYLETEEDEDRITVCMGDGQRKIFLKEEEGSYLGERAAFETLNREENGWQLLTMSKECYYFDLAGALLRQEDQNGRGIDFKYDEKKRLQRATNDNGISLFYQYDENDRLCCVQDTEGRRVSLTYRGDLLTQVRLADEQKISYSYTEDGLLAAVENAAQVTVLKNYYQRDHRVCCQDFPDGGTMSYEYDDVNHRTTLTERNGSKIVYVQDEKYRNTDILYEDGTTEHFEYNWKNQKTAAVDRNGVSCRMAYDSRGNLTQIVYESGLKINYTYDGNSRLLCFKLNGKEKLHNTYDAKGNLIQAVSADGTVSKVSYDEKGRVIRVEEAGGKMTRLSYDASGNVEKVSDALGNETGYVYDRLGRVIETTDANGERTCYAYDAEDRLVHVINPIGAERKYQYTVSGKVEKVIDFDGYEVRASYNCLDKLDTYVDKEGNETHFTYDKMWNIASKTTPDGGVTEYRYNADNRLTQISLLEEGSITYEYGCDKIGLNQKTLI